MLIPKGTHIEEELQAIQELNKFVILAFYRIMYNIFKNITILVFD